MNNKITTISFLYIFGFTYFVLLSCNGICEKKIANREAIDTTTLKERANYFYDAKEYLKAKLSYDTLITLDSMKAGYYFKRGYSKSMLLNDDEGAIADYLKSIQLNYSKKHSAYLNIGVLFRSKEKYDSALYYLNQCLKIDSANIKALQEKEEVLRSQTMLNNF